MYNRLKLTVFLVFIGTQGIELVTTCKILAITVMLKC